MPLCGITETSSDAESVVVVHKCPNHPTNHDKGCTPCIAKNLGQGEIPACFFKKANPDKKPSAYFFEDFAKMVLEK